MEFPFECPCGGDRYATCCGPYLAGTAVPAKAVLLMRSRYVAFVLRADAYLRTTWDESTRPVAEEPLSDANMHWLGLEIRRQQEKDNEAIVEFVARYRLAGKGHRLQETSHFVRKPDAHQSHVMRWFYVGALSLQQR